MKDYTKENFDFDGLKQLMPVFSNFFPDVLYKMIIINLGFIASKIINILLMLAHEVTR